MSSMPRVDPADFAIEPSSEDLIPEVLAMNARIAEAGSHHGFYDRVKPNWLAPEPGATVWREFFLLVEKATGKVRGGYGLKHERFLLNGEDLQLGWLQGPTAESVIKPEFKGIGGIMVRDAQRRYPMQISWGANSIAAPSAGSAPMLLRVIKPSKFLREFRQLEGKWRHLADVAAATGLASPAVRIFQRFQAGVRPRPKFSIELPDSFAGWADVVWSKAKSAYNLIAVRDGATLDRLLPRDTYPNAIPIKVLVNARVVGWAALRLHQLENDVQFGNVLSGSVIDALAIPGFEDTVALAASEELERRTPDLLGACFLHERWINAFKRAGWLVLPKRRNIGFSSELQAAGGGLSNLLHGTHLSLIDSDGPRIF